MKILHVTKKYPNALGGDAVVVSNLEKQQKLAGHKVVILTSNCDEISNDKHIYKFGLKDTPANLDNITPKRLLSLIMLFFTAYRVIKTEQPDVIHTHSVDMAFFISFAARHYKVPIMHTFHIVTFNDPKQSRVRSSVELKFLKGVRPSKIFILNPGDKKDFVAAGFNNTFFVPNGVNIEDWAVSKPKMSNNTFTFIAVGRLEEQKGFKYLIDAAADLRKLQNNFVVQIVGEGSQHNELKDLIENNGLNDVVFLLGRKTPAELRKLYSEADAFVLSSLWEGMPLSLLEAWSASLPAIVTKVNSVPYMAKGIAEMVTPRNSSQLAEAMKTFINTPKLVKISSEKGLREITLKYQWSKITETILKLYKNELDT